MPVSYQGIILNVGSPDGNICKHSSQDFSQQLEIGCPKLATVNYLWHSTSQGHYTLIV